MKAGEFMMCEHCLCHKACGDWFCLVKLRYVVGDYWTVYCRIKWDLEGNIVLLGEHNNTCSRISPDELHEPEAEELLLI